MRPFSGGKWCRRFSPFRAQAAVSEKLTDRLTSQPTLRILPPDWVIYMKAVVVRKRTADLRNEADCCDATQTISHLWLLRKGCPRDGSRVPRCLHSHVKR